MKNKAGRILLRVSGEVKPGITSACFESPSPQTQRENARKLEQLFPE